MKFFRLAKWQLIRLLIHLLPAQTKTRTEDRHVLEQLIFRDLFIDTKVRRILFAGCDTYTRWYPWIFEEVTGVWFMTIEPDPAKRKYGSRRHHLVGKFQDASVADEMKNAFDVVILNGVFGFGMDTPESKQAAFRVSHEILKPGGRFLIGYNDIAEKYRFDPAWVEGCFKTARIPGMQVSDYVTKDSHRHRFVCFAKVGA